jgi:tRNA pseudouridine38-40 synthase
MQEAARHLIGRHDFSTFRSSECQAENPVRTLERLDVVQKAEEIHIMASARSFLHTQIRSITGSLEHVGAGKWSVEDFIAARDARDRCRCGVLAPPDGLYLLAVDYDRTGKSSLCGAGLAERVLDSNAKILDLSWWSL